MTTASPDTNVKTAPIIRAQESLVSIDISGVPVMKNEVGHILLDDARLKCEVLRIQGHRADLQVFEDTRGVRIGDLVELSGELLSVSCGPGMLGQVYDGLQNPLHDIAETHGFFLPRGVDIAPLDNQRKWDFTPQVAVGSRLGPGAVVGTVPEGHFEHRIMIPFDEHEEVEITAVHQGPATIDDIVFRYRRDDGSEHARTMVIRWPVRVPMPSQMLARRHCLRTYPDQPLTTCLRIIDTFLPVAQGGTGCVPGPFGAGKTVLQSTIAKNASVDIVIIIACGERAGEVVETINEYPETIDPRTGRSLMERTIIICNTSSMPVAARESSLYTGITLGEYYRQMGFNVLAIADSTSRWAQAMRETSGRMEEIPGEEAFPAYLDSAIKNVYERAGVLSLPGERTGSLTLIGTVSPAGGNFEEPVTQSTLATVKTFLGLSYDRAYKRAYPAIDPLISWSRYLDQLAEWFTAHMGPQWVADVKTMQDLLVRGDSIYQMMQVTGEEGISLDDYIVWQKSQYLDMAYLQQDQFDEVDFSVPRERQREGFMLIKRVVDADLTAEDPDTVRDFFTKLTGAHKNWNFSPAGSDDAQRFRQEIDRILASQGI